MTDRLTYALPGGPVGRARGPPRRGTPIGACVRRTAPPHEGAAGDAVRVSARRRSSGSPRDLRVADHPALRAAVDAGPDGLPVRPRHDPPAPPSPPRAAAPAVPAGGPGGPRREPRARVAPRRPRGGPSPGGAGVAAEAGAARVVVTREVPPFGRRRDDRVRRALERDRVEMVEFGGDLVVEPEDLTGSSGAGYLVFTPFSRAWRDAPLPGARSRAPGDPGPAAVDGPRAPALGRAAARGGPGGGRAPADRGVHPGRRRRRLRRAPRLPAEDATVAPVGLPALRHVHRRPGRPGARAAGARCQRGGRPSGARSAGASSTTTTSPGTPRSRGSPLTPPCGGSSGTTTPPTSRRGRRARPGSRSSTPACANWRGRGGSTTGPAWSWRRSW